MADDGIKERDVPITYKDGKDYLVDIDTRGMAVNFRPYEPTFIENAKEGLLTNNPPRGVGGFVGRNALPAVGGFVAAPAGMGVGSMASAGLGAAAGEGVRQGLVQLAQGKPQGAGETLARMGKEGATGFVGEGVSQGVRVGANALLPSLTTLATKVPKPFTEMAVKGQLKGAKTVKQAGEAYGDLTASQNLKGLDESLETVFPDKMDITTGDWVKLAQYGRKQLREGTLTPQDALWVRQAISKYKDSPKLQREQFAGVAKQLDELQTQLDNYLEEVIPGFAGVRADFFKAKAAERFKSWFPQNKDKTPETLRFFMTSLAQPAALPLMSPRIAKAGIDAGNAGGGLLAQLATQGVAEQIEPASVMSFLEKQVPKERRKTNKDGVVTR